MMARVAISGTAAVLSFAVLAAGMMSPVAAVDSTDPGRRVVVIAQRPRIDNCATYKSEYAKKCGLASNSRECVALKKYIDSYCRD